MKNRNFLPKLSLALLLSISSFIFLSGVGVNTRAMGSNIEAEVKNGVYEIAQLCAKSVIAGFYTDREISSTPNTVPPETTLPPVSDSTMVTAPVVTESPSSVISDKNTVSDISSGYEINSCLISLNIRGEQKQEEYTDRIGIIQQKYFGEITGENKVDLEYGQINNFTDTANEEVYLYASKKPDIVIEKGNAPQVLIMHTHTSESYEQTADGHYDPSYTGRSLSPSNSVVGVGAVIAQSLADKGICTVHDGTVYDDPLYNNSYSRSRERVQELLKEYPSIKVVLDIHRDGIENDGVRIAPVTEIDGEKTAQAMIICGCDDGSGILPYYKENLSFAGYLQSSISKQYPTLLRPMMFDYRFYNQDLTTGSILIEVGALGNTTKEARNCGKYLGDAIGNALLNLTE